MSRFEDTLQRDLHVIADRATPSPHAWQQIQRRIIDQDPPQETEIIMLTDNITRPRRGPLLAAAAAVAALVVGGIAFVNRGDGANDPADTPTPETIAAPEPDDAADIDTGPDTGDDADADPTATPEADTDESAEAEAASTVPRSLSLTGTLSAVLDFVPSGDGGAGSFSGDDVITGDLFGKGLAEGTYQVNDANDGLVGNNHLVLDVWIDDIGEGRLIIDEQWTSQYTGASEHTGVVAAGTGDFFGATGTWRYRAPDGNDNPATDKVETAGDYSLELTLPSQADADRGWTVDADGVVTIGGATHSTTAFTPIDDGNPDTDMSVSTTSDIDDGAATGSGVGHRVTLDSRTAFGISRLTEERTLDGFGTGTLESILVWTQDPHLSSRQYLTGATGAFEGYTGSVIAYGGHGGHPDYEVDWTGVTTLVPGPAMQRVTASGSWSDDGYTETPRDGDATLDVEYTTTFVGELDGVGLSTGTRTPHENDAGSDGAAVVEFTGSVAGVGEGTLTFREIFSTGEGPFFSVATIIDGTGDLAGARGFVQFGIGSYELDIEVPTNPVERTRVFELTASSTESDVVESLQDDGSLLRTGITTYTGQLTGQAPWVGTGASSNGVESLHTDVAFSGTIEGIGTGTLVLRTLSRSDEAGYWSEAAAVISGTGDFAGAGGWMMARGSDVGAPGTVTVELHLP